jgi:hypothetical protein
MTANISNGFDPSTVQQFVKDIERHFETLRSHQGEYMNRCKGVRDLIARAKDAAKEAGIPKKALNSLLKERELLRKIDGIRESFEDEEDLETYEALVEALGPLADTPLGRAATGSSDDDDEEDVRPRHLREQDENRKAAAENSKRLRKGVTGLPGADATEA